MIMRNRIILVLSLMAMVCIGLNAQNKVVRRGQVGDNLSSKVSVSEKKQSFSPGIGVDLGLTSGTLWADRNIGASSEVDKGGEFVWGDPTGTNKRVQAPKKMFHISGTSYDIAKTKWGVNWQLPTLEMAKELVRECTIRKETRNGVLGYVVTGPNGNSIFFPMSSRYSDRFDGNKYSFYWLGDSNDWGARLLDVSESIYFDAHFNNWARTFRFMIRPVKSK